jgi:hypothetical protein
MSACYFCLAKHGARHVVDCPATDGDPWAEETKPTLSPRALNEQATVAEDFSVDLPAPSLVTKHGTWTLNGNTWTRVA